MTRLLEDCYDRLDRADEHLKAIEREFKPFLDREPYRVIGKLYPGSPGKLHYIATAQVREHTPRRIRTLIGEFFHDLRSSLDHLAYILATPPLGGDPPPGTEFPIFKDRPLFFATARKGVRKGQPVKGSGLYKMRGMPRGPQTMIKWLQPYRRINDPERDLLWIIHDMSAGDKHRKAHITGAILEDQSLGINAMQDVDFHLRPHLTH